MAPAKRHSTHPALSGDFGCVKIRHARERLGALRSCHFLQIGYRLPRMKFFPLIMMVLGAMIVGCERHDFEETRKLHDKSSPAAVESNERADEESAED